MNILKRILKKIGVYNPKFTVMGGSYVDKQSEIGAHTYIGYNCFVTKAKIGRYCSIANNVSIGPGEHDLNLVSTNSLFYDNAYQKLTERDITLGNDVWVGANVVIRRGVKIGNGAVIGANSFVNCDVPAYAIFAGSPARLIKYRFDESRIKKIEASNWWDSEPEAARKIMSSLQS